MGRQGPRSGLRGLCVAQRVVCSGGFQAPVASTSKRISTSVSRNIHDALGIAKRNLKKLRLAPFIGQRPEDPPVGVQVPGADARAALVLKDVEVLVGSDAAASGAAGAACTFGTAVAAD